MGNRRGRGFARRRPMTVIQSVKNSFQQVTSQIAGKDGIQIAAAVEVGAATKVTGIEVPVGAKIFGIEIWVQFVSGTGGDAGTFNWYLVKQRENQPFAQMPTPDFTDQGLSNFRNQIIHSDLAVIGTEDAGPYKFHRRIKINKLFQRMRPGDSFTIGVNPSIAGTLAIGVFYKYYQ